LNLWSSKDKDDFFNQLLIGQNDLECISVGAESDIIADTVQSASSLVAIGANESRSDIIIRVSVASWASLLHEHQGGKNIGSPESIRVLASFTVGAHLRHTNLPPVSTSTARVRSSILIA